MTIRNWSRKLVRPAQQLIKKTRNNRVRLALEPLEERTVPATYHVSLAGNDANTGGVADPFRTIQRAINETAVADDLQDFINVQAGLYATPGLDQSLTIPASANISNLLVRGGFDASFISRVPGTTIYIPQNAGSVVAADVDVFDDSVTIDGMVFGFDGTVGAGGTRESAGILARGQGLVLNNNTIEVGSGNASIDAYGLQTLFGSNQGTLTVTNNSFTANNTTAFRSGGIYLNPGVAASVLIDGNTVSGSNLFQGIVADSISNVAISNNTLFRTGPADVGFSQFIYAGPFNGSGNQSNVTISGNLINRTVDLGIFVTNSVGIEVGNTSGNGFTITGVTLINNTVENNTLGLLITDGADGLTVGDGTANSGGSYTSGGVGIFAQDVANLTINNAIASNNLSDGFRGSNLTGTLAISDSTFNDNGGDGIDLNIIGTVTLSDLTITGNAAGGSINTVATVNFTGTTGSVRDDITTTSTSLQHTRDPLGTNVVNQALILSSVANLNLFGDGGNDIFIINGVPAPTDVNGGTEDDAFRFGDGATLNGGTIDGDAGIDTIDYAAYTSAVAVNLGANTPNLAANLDGDQEAPPTPSAAAGTASITYDNVAHNFDITVAVSGIDPSVAIVSGFHLHRGRVGVNGPIIVDFGTGGLVSDGLGGFTFTANDIPIDPLHEAALLGGITYINVHTNAFPGGEIRGQVFANALFVAAPGAATGTAGVTGVENAVGGSGSFTVSPATFGDSIVGDNGVNILSGGPGNDVIIGARNPALTLDIIDGGAGDDILAWSNGDGDDVMDGGLDNDVVAVNGNPTAADVFVIDNGLSGRVDFDRASPGPFSLDIGTVETLDVNGISGDDSFSVNDLTGVADLTTINLNGFNGADTFNVTANATVAVTVRGHLPRANPGGDTLNYNGSGTVNPTGPGSGSITASGVQPVTYSGIETVNAVGGTLDVVVDANDDPALGSQANDGVADTFRVVRSGDNVQVFVNGALVFEGAVSSIDEISINGSGDIDTLIVDNAGGNPIPGGGITFSAAGETGLPGDSLEILGGAFNTVTYAFTPDTPDGGPFTANGHNGSVNLDGSVIRYTGLEPLSNTGTSVISIFDLPDDGVDNQAILEDDGDLNNGMVQLRSGNGTFESTVFANPSLATRINASNDGETVTVARLDAGYAAYVDIFGNTGNDTVRLDFSSGVNIIPQTLAPPHIVFNGGGGADGIVLVAGYSATSIAHTFEDEGIGSTAFDGLINIDGGVVRYRDLDQARGIFDPLSAVNRSFTFAASTGADVIAIGDDPAGPNGVSRITSDNSPLVDFSDPSSMLTVNAGAGDDDIQFRALDAVAPSPPTIVINGDAGNDDLTVDFAFGDPTPPAGPTGSLSFNGGAENATPGDRLFLINVNANTLTLTLLADDANGHRGMISLDGVQINYEDLEPVSITGTVANAVINLPDDGVDNQAILEDDTGGVAGVSQVRSDNGTFETTAFTNPTTSLTVNASDDGETITVATLDSAFAAAIDLNGNLGNDRFNITPSATSTINADGAAPSGAGSAPGDTLDVNTAGTTNPILTITATNGDSKDGNYTFTGRQTVTFTSIETLIADVDLRVTKTDSPDPVIAGTNVNYTIVVSNPGTLGVAGATVSDVFPAVLTGVTFTSVAAGGASGNTVAGAGNINDTVSLPAGSSITYSVTGTVSPSATGSLSNTATVSPPAGITDSAPGDNSDTATTTINTLADLAVTKTDSPDPVKVAGNITYTITLTNNGASDALGVTLSDAVPANTTFVSFTAPAGFTTTTPPPGGTGTVTAVAPTFAAGAVATFTLVVRVRAQAPPNLSIVNTVTVSSATPDNVPANNSATATTEIANVPYIAVGAAPGFKSRVAVISPSGAKLAAFLAFNPNFTGGVRVAVGDVNNDGVSDIIVAQASRGGAVKIVDGTKIVGLSPNSTVPNSALLAGFFAYQRGFRRGVFVAAGDVNGDGRDDIITGPGGGANARVKVIDAARLHLVDPDGRISFAALHGHFLPYQPNFRGGVSVAAGDVNGDDRADVLTGPASGARPVKVVDGTKLNLTQPDGRIANAALLAAFFAYETGFTGGVSLAAEFVNSDNRADIVTAPAFGKESRVNVIDATKLNQVGANGRILPSAFLASQVVFEEDFRGGAQVGAMDLDNDGLAEILAGFGPTRRRVLGLDMLQFTTQLIVDVNFGAGSLGGNS